MGERVETHIQQLQDFTLRPHVVSAEWLLECAKTGKCAPEENFTCLDLTSVANITPQPKLKAVEEELTEKKSRLSATNNDKMGGKQQDRSKRFGDVDGGWSWMVLAGCSIGTMLFGLAFTAGIFNIIFLEVFGTSKQVTAWVTATQSSLWCLGSLLSSVLNDRLGPSTTVVIGGLFGATGYLLTYFADRFVYVFISFGIISGLGLGISYVPCVVIISLYFEHYRNLAYGVTTTAIGIGTIVLPQLTLYAADEYGWRGAMLILSGVNLQFLICGVIFYPKWYKQRSVPHVNLDIATENNSDNIRTSELSIDVQEVKEKYMKDQTLVNCTNVSEASTNSTNVHNATSSKTGEANENPTILKHNLSCHDVKNMEYCVENIDAKMGIENEKENERGSSELFNQGNADIVVDLAKEFDTNQDYSNRAQIHLEANETPTTSSFRRILSKRGFLLFCGSVFCLGFATFIAYVHFPAYFTQQGATTSELSICLLVFGICSIVSRMLAGVATNSPDFDSLTVYMASAGLMGFLHLLCPMMAGTQPGRLLYSALFGVYGNWCYSLLAPVTLMVVSTQELSKGFGLLNFCGGFGLLVGPPVAGALFDLTETYVYSFYLAGLLFMVSFACSLSIPLVKRPGDTSSSS